MYCDICALLKETNKHTKHFKKGEQERAAPKLSLPCTEMGGKLGRVPPEKSDLEACCEMVQPPALCKTNNCNCYSIPERLAGIIYELYWPTFVHVYSHVNKNP